CLLLRRRLRGHRSPASRHRRRVLDGKAAGKAQRRRLLQPHHDIREAVVARHERAARAGRGGRVNYADFTKKLILPPDFEAPRKLTYEDLVAEALERSHLDDDVAGINASIELIQRTRGGKWPTGPVTEEEDYADLVWHEVEFRDAFSLSYAVYEADGPYIGCAYLYPMGRRTQLTAELLDRDVDVSWW